MRSLLHWKYIELSNLGEYFLIGFNGGQGMCLPRQIVGDDHVATEFFEQATAWAEMGKWSETDRIKRYLADRTLYCPKCEYNLRGASPKPPEHACPECGKPLTMELLMGAKQG